MEEQDEEWRSDAARARTCDSDRGRDQKPWSKPIILSIPLLIYIRGILAVD